jgi:cytoskeletal protein RodZ
VLSWADSTPEAELTGPLSGPELAKIRIRKNLSLEDVFRITRIPLKYLKAIEQDQWTHLPARVYIQGFIKNLAHAYKMPAQETLQKYLQHFDSAHSPSA